MLELRPNCEWCDKDLPAESSEAMICTYECTYCATCVRDVLHNVCATCGGGFAPRPVRPLKSHHPELGLGRENHPPAVKRTHSRWSPEAVEAFSQSLRNIPPEQR